MSFHAFTDSKKYFLSLGLTIFIACESGFWAAWLQTHCQTAFPNLPVNAVMVEGRLEAAESRATTIPHVLLWRLKLTDPVFKRDLDQGMQPLKRAIDISWRSDRKPPEIGSKIAVRALLHLPSAPVWPGGYDPQRRAWFSGLGAKGRALDAPVILEEPEKMKISALFYQWDSLREKVALKIKNFLKNPDHAAVAEILLCGKEGDLSPELRAAFAAAGLAHILAVAGLHLGMVTAFVGFLAFFLLRRSEWVLLRFSAKRLAALAGLAAGAAYIFFTGAHLPGLRALGVASLAMLAFHFRRNPFSLRSLAFVALAFEICCPAIILNAAFQMSFCAVMALGAGYRALIPVTGWIRSRGWVGHHVFLPLFTLVMTSLLAGLAVMPSVMARFGLFQPWFVLANLVAVPLMGLWVMPLGILALCAMPFGLEQPFLWLMGKGIAGIVFSAHWASTLPAASISVPAVPGWALALSLFGLSLLCLGLGHKRYFGLVCIFAGAVIPFYLPKPFLFFSSSGRVAVWVNRNSFSVFSSDSAKNTWEKKFLLENWAAALGQKEFVLEKILCGERKYCVQNFTEQGSDLRIGWITPDIGRQERKKAFEDLCGRADLLISFAYGSGQCSKIPTLTPLMGWKNGSYAAFRRKGRPVRLVSDSDMRGRRPWVYPPSRQGLPNIPMALSE